MKCILVHTLGGLGGCLLDHTVFPGGKPLVGCRPCPGHSVSGALSISLGGGARALGLLVVLLSSGRVAIHDGRGLGALCSPGRPGWDPFCGRSHCDSRRSGARQGPSLWERMGRWTAAPWRKNVLRTAQRRGWGCPDLLCAPGGPATCTPDLLGWTSSQRPVQGPDTCSQS